MPQKICIVNASTVLKDVDIESTIPALQAQVSQDFAPAWGLDVDLSFTSSTPDKEAWHLIVLDDSDQADALGYHDFTSNGLPIGKIFANTDIQNGNSWTNTLSHELLEMLADPEINLCATTEDRLYAYEVCDAVEADNYGYKRDDILLSDFVYPSWFSPNASGPYDHMGLISKPFTLAPGGYISVMDLYGSGWRQITNSSINVRRAPVGSRRERRIAPRELLRRSVR